MLELRDTAAAQGVVLLFRDAVQHPENWPELDHPVAADQDPVALATGAMVVAFGLVEVVLLVGAALAVGARRQIRTLGLLASTGGSPRDVRRVVLARGLLIGGGASLAAVVVGLVGLRLSMPWVGRVTGSPLLTLDIVWSNVVVIALLGTLSGLLAAAYPAWVVGRMSAVDALAGRFPSGHRVARLHPAAGMAGGRGTRRCRRVGFLDRRRVRPPAGAGSCRFVDRAVAAAGDGRWLLPARPARSGCSGSRRTRSSEPGRCPRGSVWRAGWLCAMPPGTGSAARPPSWG